MTIWKFPVTRNIDVLMPKGATILHFGSHEGELMVWAMVDPQAPMEPRALRVCGTGWEIEAPKERLHYIGTAHQGSFVWHLFEYLS